MSKLYVYVVLRFVDNEPHILGIYSSRCVAERVKFKYNLRNPFEYVAALRFPVRGIKLSKVLNFTLADIYND